ncbi:MAG: glycosyltransferase [Cytophagales bacterium]|nr:MAG: glycosyltransferase [Cytophagales bacterium]
MKDLSIIIVNYNVCFFLEQVLLSIRKSSKNLQVEVLIVDNNSADSSVAMVKKKFSECILIENKENVGFSKANNQAIRVAKGKYILLLNPDTVLEEDTLEKCFNFMNAHPEAGGLGAMMLDGSGNFLPESKRGFPTPWVAFYKVFGLAKLFSGSQKFGHYHLGYLDKNKTHEIEVLSGAFMFLRTEALKKTGLLDEDYFMYGEDIDLSYRIIKAGYKNYYFPETRIIHYKGESTKRSSINYVFIFYKAMIIFANKHFSNTNAQVFSFLIHIAIYIRASISLLNRTIKKLTLPIIDVLIMYIGMYFLNNFYEINFKTYNHFPPEFLRYIVPVYISIWIITNYYSGGYDKKTKSSKIIRGVVVGTIMISALSNFFDFYRFSRVLIIADGLWACVALLLIRLVVHFTKYKNFEVGETSISKIAILGSYLEANRAKSLISNNANNNEIIGFISRFDHDTSEDNYLGHSSRISEIIRIYGIDELIFCSKDFKVKEIISLMMSIKDMNIGYKILPDDSDYIIGSNSKNSNGELYTLNIDLNILQRSAKRNKRVLDFLLSGLLLLLSPLLMWFTVNPLIYIRNLIKVFTGSLSFVGFSKTVSVQVPKIKNGILNPVSHFDINTIDLTTLNRLNMLYAKNYTVYKDLFLILKSFRFLGVG